MWANLDVILGAWLPRDGAWRAGGAVLAACVLVVLVSRVMCTALTPTTIGIRGVKALDVTTGDRFTITLDTEFRGWPVHSPFSGERTGYPATVCRSTRCAADGGTWVVREADRGLPGTTFCPRCAEVVRPRVH